MCILFEFVIFHLQNSGLSMGISQPTCNIHSPPKSIRTVGQNFGPNFYKRHVSEKKDQISAAKQIDGVRK